MPEHVTDFLPLKAHPKRCQQPNNTCDLYIAVYISLRLVDFKRTTTTTSTSGGLGDRQTSSEFDVSLLLHNAPVDSIKQSIKVNTTTTTTTTTTTRIHEL